MSTVKRRGAGWQGTYRGPDGRERTQTFAKKVDAENWVADERSKMARGAWIDPRAGRITLRSFAQDWLDGRTDLRPTTRGKYRYLLDCHILPTLGTTQLANLSPRQIRSWHTQLHDEHAATSAGAYRLLSTLCRSAVADEIIGRSPCRLRGAGTECAGERPTITVAELEVAVESAPEPYRLALLLAAWCQLRRAEVLGLQRRDIDEALGTLSIERTWTLQTDGTAVLGPPKSAAGRRTVTVPANVVPVLTIHLTRLAGSSSNDWLFPGKGGNPVSPRTLDRVWQLARAAAARSDVRFHDLRHSGLTWSAATGATTAELMRRGGHASAAAAIRYQHATEDRDRMLADALAQLATPATVIPIESARRTQVDSPADNPRTRGADPERVNEQSDSEQGISWQPHRDSNPCLHLERVVS